LPRRIARAITTLKIKELLIILSIEDMDGSVSRVQIVESGGSITLSQIHN